MSDLAFASATALASMVRERRISSRELLDHYLDRCEHLDPRVHAVVTIDADGARARADAADRTLARGDAVGPLHGLPVTIKDTIETAGIRTAAGFAPLATHVPATDAVAVERLVRAGAIVFGKTNVPTLAGDWQSYNDVFETTSNPWDAGRTPGGSSGGSAAALAAGLTAFELGSDIAGSIRVPAHWCGVFGHKPTHGLVPLRGHIPGPPGVLAEADLAVLGPMARSADDLGLLLDVLAGPPCDRAKGWSLALPAARARRLEDYRVAAWLDDPAFPVDPAVAACLRRAVSALRDAGVQVDEEARPALRLEEVVDVYLRLLWPVMLAGHPPEAIAQLRSLAESAPENVADHTIRMARYGTAMHRDWLGANEVRARMRAAAAEFFERYDVLLMPVNQVAAIAHDHGEPQMSRTVEIAGGGRPYFDLAAWIAAASALELPATSAPIGRTDADTGTRTGLPVGIQIVAPYLEDRTALDFAARLAEIHGGFQAPPGF